MSSENVLDFGRVDVLAATDDHVLEPVDDEQITLLVHIGGVAGVQPTLTQGVGGFFRFVPVALHDVRPPDDDLADRTARHLTPVGIDNFHLHAKAATAHRARQPTDPRFGAVVARQVTGYHRAGLGETIGVGQLDIG
ncbi:hypothetical protein D3C72_1512350 [compost metagenome]